jgi:hypothetical protein
VLVLSCPIDAVHRDVSWCTNLQRRGPEIWNMCSQSLNGLALCCDRGNSKASLSPPLRNFLVQMALHESSPDCQIQRWVNVSGPERWLLGFKWTAMASVLSLGGMP